MTDQPRTTVTKAIGWRCLPCDTLIYDPSFPSPRARKNRPVCLFCGGKLTTAKPRQPRAPHP